MKREEWKKEEMDEWREGWWEGGMKGGMGKRAEGGKMEDHTWGHRCTQVCP